MDSLEGETVGVREVGREAWKEDLVGSEIVDESDVRTDRETVSLELGACVGLKDGAEADEPVANETLNGEFWLVPEVAVVSGHFVRIASRPLTFVLSFNLPELLWMTVVPVVVALVGEGEV